MHRFGSYLSGLPTVNLPTWGQYALYGTVGYLGFKRKIPWWAALGGFAAVYFMVSTGPSYAPGSVLTGQAVNQVDGSSFALTNASVAPDKTVTVAGIKFLVTGSMLNPDGIAVFTVTPVQQVVA